MMQSLRVDRPPLGQVKYQAISFLIAKAITMAPVLTIIQCLLSIEPLDRNDTQMPNNYLMLFNFYCYSASSLQRFSHDA